MRDWLVAVALVAVGLQTAACGRRPAAPGGVSPEPTIDVVLREWTIEPAPLQARAGRVIFRVRNEGVVDHNLAIEGRRDADARTIKPGESQTLSARLEAGAYTAVCNLPGHREAGMVTALRVTP